MSNFTTSGRLVDKTGYVPSSSVGVSIAKSLFKDHAPFIVAGSLDTGLTIEFNFHFLQNLRRVLAGTTGDTQFSTEEQLLYEDYLEYLSGTTTFTEYRFAILDAVDAILVDFLMGKSQLKMVRSLVSNNQWVKY